mmetsp:Transcript_93179/g.221644  ORF Transcript_93179/g.221644 Transcript_93179/m.221644 type:complete len:614 (+) Transcript_93179:95-1936(+)
MQAKHDEFWSQSAPSHQRGETLQELSLNSPSPDPPNCCPKEHPTSNPAPLQWSESDDEEEMAWVADTLARSNNVDKFLPMPDSEDRKEKIRTLLVRKSYDVTNFYHETGCFQHLARTNLFENATLFVITANALWIAYDTDNNKANTVLDAKLEFQIMENFFCFYFTFEWVIRFGAFRRKCNCIKDYWFVFDSLLVALMIAETWVLPGLLLLSGNGAELPAGGTDVLRLFRLLRLTRMARMLRSITELMILIKGMAAAARSVFFVMCLLVIIIYVFSIAFTQLAAGTVMGSFYFPTVQHSMYTLLIYGTFLDDIAPFCDEVGAESVACLVLVFVFAILAACTVLNMLIGILCEVVSAVATTEKEDMMVHMVTVKLERLLQNGDTNNDGNISQAEFVKILKMPEAVLALEEVGIDPVSIIDFTDYIFGGEDSVEDTLNFPKFMEVILKLRQTNECTIRDMVDLRRQITSQLVTAQDVILEDIRAQCERARQGAEERREDLVYGTGDASGTGSTSDRQPCPTLNGLKARTDRLEELMKKTLKEVQELLQRTPVSAPEEAEEPWTVASQAKPPKARVRPPEQKPDLTHRLPRAQVLPKGRDRPPSEHRVKGHAPVLR